MIATSFLIVQAVKPGDAASGVGASVLAASMELLCSTSMLYHALPTVRALQTKRVSQVTNPSAIYLLIAGTYTLFPWVCCGAPGVGRCLAWSGRGRWVAFWSRLLWVLLGTAICVLFLAIGWIALTAIKPMWQLMPGWGLFELVAGGLADPQGLVFFLLDERVSHALFVWRLFVMAGTGCHAAALLY